jgi:hypothetical protein
VTLTVNAPVLSCGTVSPTPTRMVASKGGTIVSVETCDPWYGIGSRPPGHPNTVKWLWAPFGSR